MFRRVILENWLEFVPYICFGLIAGSFLVIVIRAIMMKKSEVERLSRLPLSDEFTTTEDSDTTKSKNP